MPPSKRRCATPEEKARRLYEELHEYDPNPKESFDLFLTQAGLEKVEEYLHDLQELYMEQNDKAKIGLKCLWHELLKRQLKLNGILKLITNLTTSKREQIIKLAFLRQHPTFYGNKQITPDHMIAALENKSSEDAVQILNAILVSHNKVHPVQSPTVQGYMHQYLRPDLTVDPILNQLSNFASEWDPKHYLAPYTTLIGPTMIGKTRLLMELSKHVCVIYICLRPSNSSGQPPRSSLADELLEKKTNSHEEHYSRFLAALFECVANFFNKQDSKMDERARLKEWFDFIFPGNSQSIETKDISEEIKEQMRQMGDLPLVTLIYNATKKMLHSTSFIKNTNLKVLLAIDEARELLHPISAPDGVSLFRVLRRTLSSISSKEFFTVFTDTTSKISNFYPSLKYGPSARPTFIKGNKLFAPLIHINTFDLMVPTCRPQTWKELLSPDRLLAYGIPFFSLYLKDATSQNHNVGTTLTTLDEFALQKLLCVSQVSASDCLTVGQVFALLGPTIQPQTPGASHLNSELVSSHAAHCLYIDQTLEHIISSYPSQYIYASAANRFLDKNNHHFVGCIETLIVTVRQGLVSSGTVGELASTIILLCAMQKTMAASKARQEDSPDLLPFGIPVRLGDFLSTLTGQKEDKLNLGTSISPKNKKRLLEGKLFWNHFIQIKYTPTQDQLLQYLYSCHAVQCKPYQTGFDQLFGIDLQSQPMGCLHKENITFCGIQAKNLQDDINIDLEEYSNEWTPKFSGINIDEQIPYLVLYFGLRSKKNQLTTMPDLPFRAGLAFHGLETFGCLSPQMITALHHLLLSEQDPIKLYNNNQGPQYVTQICRDDYDTLY